MIEALIASSDLAIGLGVSGDHNGMAMLEYEMRAGAFASITLVETDPLISAGWRWRLSPQATNLPPFFQLGLTGGNADSLQTSVNLNIGFGFSWRNMDVHFTHISPGRHDEDRTADNKDGLNFLLVSWRF